MSSIPLKDGGRGGPRELRNEYAAIKAVAARLGIGSPETVRKWLRRAEVDAGSVGRAAASAPVIGKVGLLWLVKCAAWLSGRRPAGRHGAEGGAASGIVPRWRR